jgi:hypothetical protein
MEHVRALGDCGLVRGVDVIAALDREGDVVEAGGVELELLLGLRPPTTAGDRSSPSPAPGNGG